MCMFVCDSLSMGVFVCVCVTTFKLNLTPKTNIQIIEFDSTVLFKLVQGD